MRHHLSCNHYAELKQVHEILLPKPGFGWRRDRPAERARQRYIPDISTGVGSGPKPVNQRRMAARKLLASIYAWRPEPRLRQATSGCGGIKHGTDEPVRYKKWDDDELNFG